MSTPWSERITVWFETKRPDPGPVARSGLGITILLAGIHKVIAPTAWTIYLIEPIEPLVLVTPVEFMVLNGFLEIGFGLALVIGWWTLGAVIVVLLSLAATTVYLSIVAVLRGGLFLDILIRDVGLTALAATVFLQQWRVRRG